MITYQSTASDTSLNLQAASPPAHHLYHINRTLYTGRPTDSSNRLAKELRTYDLLDSLHITYSRLDHDALPTIEACQGQFKNLFPPSARPTLRYIWPRFGQRSPLRLPHRDQISRKVGRTADGKQFSNWP